MLQYGDTQPYKRIVSEVGSAQWQGAGECNGRMRQRPGLQRSRGAAGGLAVWRFSVGGCELVDAAP